MGRQAVVIFAMEPRVPRVAWLIRKCMQTRSSWPVVQVDGTLAIIALEMNFFFDKTVLGMSVEMKWCCVSSE
jgi:hypothetical protein